MKIIIAKNAGFCFGVKRAVNAVYENLGEKDKIYTLGPIIHNPQVVDELIKKGVIIEENVENINEGTVVIRSHGVSEEVMNCIKKNNIDYIDATCPYVKRIHDLVKRHYLDGYHIIIIGEKEHAEVIGINGWCSNSASIVNSLEDITALPYMEKACVVSQTTANRHKFAEFLEKIREKVEDIKVFNTICNATSERQKEAEEIARTADKVFVIGGRNSSNTHKLYSLCKKHCAETYAVETVDDVLLHLHKLKPHDVVGIVAGASTPDWIIKEAVNKMNEINNEFEEKKLNNNGPDIDSSPEAVSAEGSDNNGNLQESVDIEANNNDSLAETAGAKSPESGQTVSETDGVKEDESSTSEEDNAASVVNNDDAPEKSPADTGNMSEAEDASVETEPDTDDITTMEDFEKTMVSLRPGQVVKGTVLQISDEDITVNVGYKSDGIVPLKDILLDKDQVPADVFKVGDEIEVTVVKVNDGEGNVLLSQKANALRKLWKEIEESFKKQTVVNATGHEVVKGGIIAKIKGINAFVPASQLSTHYVDDLNTFIGEPLSLKILELDKRRNRVVASQRVVLEEIQKQKEENLWSSLQEGQRITGEVKRLTSFGAFVDIGGIDGLVHISDISWHHIKHPKDVLSEGDKIEVVVLSLNPEKKKISLGYKQTLPHPWDNIENKYPEGEIFEGKVVRMTDFGAFVELEPGVDGLVHISQISRERVNKVQDVLALNQTVKVKVLQVKPDEKRISLSIKEAEDKEPEVAADESADKDDSQYVKEDMTVVLGEFFPEKMHEE